MSWLFLPTERSKTENIQWAAVLWLKMSWCERSASQKGNSNSKIKTVYYNQGMQKPIFEDTARQRSKQVGSGSRRPLQVPPLSASRKLRLQYTQANQSKTTVQAGGGTHFSSLVPREHCLNTTANPNIVADYIHYSVLQRRKAGLQPCTSKT